MLFSPVRQVATNRGSLYGRPVSVRWAISLLAGAVLALAFVPTADARATHRCATFTGPGDSLVHSRNFRVARISCATGKRVVEKCRNDGTPCRIAGVTWRCHARGIPGEDRCTSGPRLAEIFWLD